MYRAALSAALFSTGGRHEQKSDGSQKERAARAGRFDAVDKYLKVSRIIKRRSVANDACSTGHITVNGKEAKPGTDVRVGDVLGVRFGEKYTEYEVLSIGEHALKQDAADMYRVKA